TGSGRSIAGVDLGRLVRRAVKEQLLIKGGGHAMAAGVTPPKEALSAVRAFVEEELAPPGEASLQEDALPIDAAMSAGAATVDTVATLMRAGPFGAGNPEPVLAFAAHMLVYVEEVGQAHARVRLRAGDGSIINGIAFRAAAQPLGAALARAR